MFSAPKIILASAVLAMVPACSSELSQEEQEILDARLEDATGGKSTVIMTDVDASNGVIHAIDTVVMPG